MLIQAMACGCPVVSTDCPSGPREILEDGRYGPLVPVGDVPALTAAIDAVLTQPPDKDLLRRRAQDFTVEKSVDGYLPGIVSRRQPSRLTFHRMLVATPDLVPGLKHQDVPQQLRVAAPAILVLPPQPADELGVQHAGPVQALLAEQFLRPAAQRSSQPAARGGVNPCFGRSTRPAARSAPAAAAAAACRRRCRVDVPAAGARRTRRRGGPAAASASPARPPCWRGRPSPGRCPAGSRRGRGTS